MALEVWWASYEPNSFCWTSVTCHKYCESGSRGCLAGCRRAPSFSKACDLGISARVGNTTSRPYLIEGRGITRSAPSGWRRPAQNAAWTRGQSGRGTTKGSASLPMRTRWTSWTCLVCGATIVDCNEAQLWRHVWREPGLWKFFGTIFEAVDLTFWLVLSWCLRVPHEASMGLACPFWRWVLVASCSVRILVVGCVLLCVNAVRVIILENQYDGISVCAMGVMGSLEFRVVDGFAWPVRVGEGKLRRRAIRMKPEMYLWPGKWNR